MLNYIKKIALDVLFPIHCLFCKRYGQWVCNDCLKKIIVLSEQVCPYCEKNISPSGRICQDCKIKFLKNNRNYSLDLLIVSIKYSQEGISRIIHYFKYSFIKDLGDPLAGIVSQAIISNNIPLPDLIVPVPLHPRRLRWRGFNQSEVLAQNISQDLTPGFQIPVLSNALVRKKYTPAQMKIKNYQERQQNVKNIFSLNPAINSKTLKEKNILIIDDVSTTGATLFECARALKDGGAKKIYGAVIARQEIKK
jgi:ComF family protein